MNYISGTDEKKIQSKYMKQKEYYGFGNFSLKFIHKKCNMMVYTVAG